MIFDMKNGIVTELCAGSLADCMTAANFPEIDRIELNCALELGGLTPSFSTFAEARKITGKKIICMIRPRPAGFNYSSDEKQLMFREARLFLESGADGIVFGFLNADLTVDEESTAQMCRLAHSFSKEAVFHMAFDLTHDASAAVESLISCGTDRILTRGHAENALQGKEEITSLINRYGSDIHFLPGGGVNAGNVREILGYTKSGQIHFSAKSVFHDSGAYFASDINKVRNILDQIGSLH